MDRAGREDAVDLELDVRAGQQFPDVGHNCSGTPLLPAGILGRSVETDFQGKMKFIKKPNCFGCDKTPVGRDRISGFTPGFTAELLSETDGLFYKVKAKERFSSVEIDRKAFGQAGQKKNKGFPERGKAYRLIVFCLVTVSAMEIASVSKNKGQPLNFHSEDRQNRLTIGPNRSGYGSLIISLLAGQLTPRFGCGFPEKVCSR